MNRTQTMIYDPTNDTVKTFGQYTKEKQSEKRHLKEIDQIIKARIKREKSEKTESFIVHCYAIVFLVLWSFCLFLLINFLTV